MFRIAAAVLGLWFALAELPARADDVTRLSLARQIVDVTHVTDKLRGLLPGLAPALRQALSSELVDPATADAVVERVLRPSREDLDHLSDDIAALYARELSEEDLSGILAFYRSRSGRDMLAAETAIGGAISVLAQHWAFALADRVATAAKTTTVAGATTDVPDPQRWRQEYIAVPDRAAILQDYTDPMERPEWTALRTVTLAKLIAERCRGAYLDQRVLGRYLDGSGLEALAIGDLDGVKAVVAPAFSYFDADRLKLVCAAAGFLFGDKGKLVPNLVSAGTGVPSTWRRGYLTVSPFTAFPHGRG